MPKLIFTLLLGLFGFSSVYASFPITDNRNINEISFSVEDPDISKSAKILWFAIGFIASIYGFGASIIYQLITQKKGPIKYALFGFLSLIAALIILVIIAFSGEFINPFVFS